MSEFRMKSIAETWSQIDKTDDSLILLDEMRRLFKAQNLKEVQTKTVDQAEALEEFLDAIDSFYHLKGFVDGKMSREEFEEFYSFVSTAYPDDREFKQLLSQSWLSAGQSRDDFSQLSHSSVKTRSTVRSHQVLLG